MFVCLKAYVSEEILNWHCLSLSLNADLCIHFYCLSRLRQASHRKMIQSSALRLRLWLSHFKISSDTSAFKLLALLFRCQCSFNQCLVTQADLVIKGSKFSEVQYILSSLSQWRSSYCYPGYICQFEDQAQRSPGGKLKSNKYKLRLFQFLVLYDGIVYGRRGGRPEVH